MPPARRPVQLPAIGAAGSDSGDSILSELTGASRDKAPAAAAPAVPVTTLAASGLDRASEMVAAARSTAKNRPREIEAYTVRLPVAVRRALDARVETDTEAVLATGEGRSNLPAAGHYIDAALAAIPPDPGTAAAWAAQWLAGLGAQALGEPLATGSKVRTSTKHAMIILGKRLKSLELLGQGPRVTSWQVHAAAVIRLLERLDQEDGAAGRAGE